MELLAAGTAKSVLIIIAQVLFVLTALLMAFSILLQEGKGGGLSALAGGASQQVIGTSNPLRRLTIVLAVLFFGVAVFLAKATGGGGKKRGERERDPTGQTETEGLKAPPGEEGASGGGDEGSGEK